MRELDDLDRFDQGLPAMTPLPPSEVRRRGDRLRRRNAALVIGGGVLAAAFAVGAPVVALSGGDDGRHIDPAPAPPNTRAPQVWVTTIPGSFPLGAGMGTADDPPHVGTEPGEVVFSGIVICEQDAWTPGSAATPSSDTLGAVWSDGIEGGEQRTLATYADEVTAHRALRSMASRVAECPAPEVRGHGQAIEPRALDSSTGEESYAYVDRYLDVDGYTGDGNVITVTRVGNALLLDKTYIGGSGDLSVGQHTADRLADRADTVVAAMCVFSADGC